MDGGGGVTAGDDPFGFLLPLCHVSSSQEERLRRCPFAPERYNPENDESSSESTAEIPVASTGIIMVSLPETEEGDDNSHSLEVFHTPPEESAAQSSNELRPTVDAVDGGDVCCRSPDGGGEPVVVGVGSSEADGAGTVDLSRDSDLGFLEVQLTQRENVYSDLNRSPVEVPVTESKGARVLRRELSLDDGLGKSPLKKLKISEQNLEECDEELDPERATPPNHGSALAKSGEQSSAKRKLEFTENDNSTEVIELGTEPDKDVLEMRNDASNGINGGNDLRETAQLPPACRRLPSSLLGQAENDGDKGNREEEVTMLDVLKLSKDDSDDGISSCGLLEICRRRGMTFRQPVWWPEEGTDFGGSDDLGTENYERIRRRRGGRLIV
ncbi:hypothetical protein TIFTF001_041994 [Ficus carica]|uniref:Uncharacterized protein n=1 Tax=Ficus carica TaxID=3494 RepID=A0AA88CW24_FICCA|nr:hypothetical protein TIFTF001_041994 [Ficus carica]